MPIGRPKPEDLGFTPEPPRGPFQPTALTQLARMLTAAAVAGLGVYLLQARQAMPERIATHFGFGGQPDAWGDRDITLALLWGAQLILAVMFFGLSWLIRTARIDPRYINVPRKKEFLRLPPERREPVFRLLTEMLAVIALAVVVHMALVTYGLVQVGRGEASVMNPATVFAGIGLILAPTAYYVVALSRAVKAAIAAMEGPQP